MKCKMRGGETLTFCPFHFPAQENANKHINAEPDTNIMVFCLLQGIAKQKNCQSFAGKQENIYVDLHDYLIRALTQAKLCFWQNAKKVFNPNSISLNCPICVFTINIVMRDKYMIVGH